MTDLIERLREVQGNVTKSYHNPEGPEAADEIERLREELNVTRLQRDAKLSSQTAVDEAAAREIERLRAALEQIKYECARCKYIAREALRDEYVERQEWAAEQAMAVIKEKDAEIERLRTAFVAISRAKDAYRIMLDEKVEEIERLRHEIDVQCSSEYVERILKENERLREQVANLQTRNNALYEAIDILKRGGKLK